MTVETARDGRSLPSGGQEVGSYACDTACLNRTRENPGVVAGQRPHFLYLPPRGRRLATIAHAAEQPTHTDNRGSGGALARLLLFPAASPISPLRLTARQRDFTHEAGVSSDRKAIRWRETVARPRGGINR